MLKLLLLSGCEGPPFSPASYGFFATMFGIDVYVATPRCSYVVYGYDATIFPSFPYHFSQKCQVFGLDMVLLTIFPSFSHHFPIESWPTFSRTSWLLVSCGPWWWWSANEKRRGLPGGLPGHPGWHGQIWEILFFILMYHQLSRLGSSCFRDFDNLNDADIEISTVLKKHGPLNFTRKSSSMWLYGWSGSSAGKKMVIWFP